MAEVTAFISKDKVSHKPTILYLDNQSPNDHELELKGENNYSNITLVSCSSNGMHHNNRVVNPKIKIGLKKGYFSGIWFAGLSISSGHWIFEQTSTDTFVQSILDESIYTEKTIFVQGILESLSVLLIL
jgi:hypothetical protein